MAQGLTLHIEQRAKTIFHSKEDLTTLVRCCLYTSMQARRMRKMGVLEVTLRTAVLYHASIASCISANKDKAHEEVPVSKLLAACVKVVIESTSCHSSHPLHRYSQQYR